MGYKLSYHDAQIISQQLVDEIRNLGKDYQISISHPHYASEKEVFYFMVEIPYTSKPRLHKNGSTH